MRKTQKIKRYGNIYDKRRGAKKAVTVAAAVTAALLLALLGWILYEPVRDFILDEGEGEVSHPSSFASGVQDPSSSSSVSESLSETPPESSQTPSVQPPSDLSGEMRGIYVSAEAAQDAAVLQASLGTASSAGINTVVVEAKNAAGVVCFDTENAAALDAKAVSETAYSPSQTAALIRKQGMIPAARLYAFRDPLLSSAEKELAVTYGNSNTRWLDNSADQGGKSWLNPCSQEARQYLIDLSVELTRAGFDTILLDAVQFPSGVGLDKAGYGVNGNFSRSDVLKSFISDVTSAVEQAGGHVLVCVAADHIETEEENKALSRENVLLYGGSPEILAGERAVLMLSSNTDASARYALAKSLLPKTKWIASLPAYSSDGAAAAASDILAPLGISDGYLLYNPQGTYLFR